MIQGIHTQLIPQIRTTTLINTGTTLFIAINQHITTAMII